LLTINLPGAPAIGIEKHSKSMIGVTMNTMKLSCFCETWLVNVYVRGKLPETMNNTNGVTNI